MFRAFFISKITSAKRDFSLHYVLFGINAETSANKNENPDRLAEASASSNENPDSFAEVSASSNGKPNRFAETFARKKVMICCSLYQYYIPNGTIEA